MRVLGRAVGSSEFDIDLVPAGAAPFVQTPAGPLSAFYVGAGAVEVDAVRFAIGPVENTGDSAFLDIGQIVCAEAFELRATRDWSEALENLTKRNETLSGQDFPVARPSRRIASVRVAPLGYAAAMGATDGLQALQASLASFRPVLVVPMLRPPGRGKDSPIDQDTVRRTALFGSCSDLGTIALVPGSNRFDLSLKFRETPG
jgi:hypothetical protein